MLRCWDSIDEASRFYKVAVHQIRAALDGRKKSTLGTRWEHMTYEKLELVDPAINQQEVENKKGSRTNKVVVPVDLLTPARQLIIDKTLMDLDEELKKDLKLPSILLGKGIIEEVSSSSSEDKKESKDSMKKNEVVGAFGDGAKVSTAFGDGIIQVLVNSY